MEEVEVLIPLIAIISIFIVLPGMVLHYLTRNKEIAAKGAGDPTMNSRLVDIAERLERRIEAIESVLEHEMPGWKKPVERRNA
ncbi:MAG: envelope stress response membrane protein PspB [Gammaproteobacteria bacterium]